MKVYRTLIISIITLSVIGACKYDTLHRADMLDVALKERMERAAPDGDYRHFLLPSNTDYAAIPQDPLNPLTPEKIALGKYLFFETGIAQNALKESGVETYSCGSCHVPTAGFRPGNAQGIADGGMGFGLNGELRQQNPEYDETELDVQGIRPISVLNVAYVTNTFWNGQFGAGFVNEGTEHLWTEEDNTHINHTGHHGLEAQNIEGLDLHRMEMSKELADEYGYTTLFDLAFRDSPASERYTKYNTAMAISAYLRTLITNKAPFQDWIRGDYNAMTDQEKRGGILFFGKARCSNCHNNTSLNAMEFYGLGVDDLHEIGALNTGADDPKNLGRGGFTQDPNDLYKFKVPQLYNLSDAPFYFHGSSKQTLEEVVDYFDRAEPENENVPATAISNKFVPLGLTAEEKADLLAFLRNGLNDPYLNRYVPPYVQSGYCFPNNDPLSAEQMGCE